MWRIDVFEAIRGRRSIRAYNKQDVADEDLRKILDAARLAPSAGNVQPWTIITVKNLETKQRLVKAALGQSFIAEAAVDIIVCLDLDRANWAYGERGVTLYCIHDSAAAIQNILLSAFALGLGTCWVGAFNEEAVSRILGLPRRHRPVAIIPVGHPAEKPSPRSKRSLREILHEEKF